MTRFSSRYNVSDGAAYYRKFPSKKTKHPFLIILEPHNHSVSVREYLFETKSTLEFESWMKALESVHQQGDFIVFLCLRIQLTLE